MATNRVRACARKVTGFHERFESCFGRIEAQAHSLVYLKGLILSEGRKNVERIALRFSTARGGGPPTQNEVGEPRFAGQLNWICDADWRYAAFSSS